MKIPKKYIHQSGRYKGTINQKAAHIAGKHNFSYRDPHPHIKGLFFGGQEKSGRQKWLTEDKLRPLKITNVPSGIPIHTSGRQRGKVNQDILQTGNPQGTYSLGDKHPNKMYTHTFFLRFTNTGNKASNVEIWGTQKQVNNIKETQTRAWEKLKADPERMKAKLEKEAQRREENRDLLRERGRKHYAENKEKIKARVKEYTKKNLKTIREKEAKRREENRDKLNEYFRNFYHQNKNDPDYQQRRKESAAKMRAKPEHKAKEKAYQQAHRDEINARMRKYYLQPDKKFRRVVSGRIAIALKNNSGEKAYKTLEYLGSSIETARAHIEENFEEGMTWENHGEWHIDHIIPCAHFDLTDPEEQKKCFHYTNLQPLWAHDNLSKGDKLDWQKSA